MQVKVATAPSILDKTVETLQSLWGFYTLSEVSITNVIEMPDSV